MIGFLFWSFVFGLVLIVGVWIGKEIERGKY